MLQTAMTLKFIDRFGRITNSTNAGWLIYNRNDLPSRFYIDGYIDWVQYKEYVFSEPLRHCTFGPARTEIHGNLNEYWIDNNHVTRFEASL